MATRGQAPGTRAPVRCALCLFLPSVWPLLPQASHASPLKIASSRGFPGGPVVKTLRFP